MNLSQYTIEELVEIKNQISNAIFFYDDGYKYICNVRSYGRTWSDKGIKNAHSLKKLCNQFDGEGGIVDVYSTNPNLSKIDNYGDVMYIKSEDDYYKWKKYENLKREIPELEKEWEEWDNRDNVPFNKRPYFAPIYTREDIIGMKNELENYNMSFTPPKRYE